MCDPNKNKGKYNLREAASFLINTGCLYGVQCGEKLDNRAISLIRNIWTVNRDLNCLINLNPVLYKYAMQFRYLKPIVRNSYDVSRCLSMVNKNPLANLGWIKGQVNGGRVLPLIGKHIVSQRNVYRTGAVIGGLILPLFQFLSATKNYSNRLHGMEKPIRFTCLYAGITGVAIGFDYMTELTRMPLLKQSQLNAQVVLREQLRSSGTWNRGLMFFVCGAGSSLLKIALTKLIFELATNWRAIEKDEGI